MSGTLAIRWTVASASAPQPLIHCSRCDAERSFESSGKFRLNANGKKLDAWLVYRCTGCDSTWNRPVFERRLRGDIEPDLLEALHGNDQAFAGRIAFDIAGLRRWCTRIGQSADVEIRKSAITPIVGSTDRLEIRVAMPALAAGSRSDRLLAKGLGIPRGRIGDLVRRNRLILAPGSAKALSRPMRDGTMVTIDLAGEPDAATIAANACGVAPAPSGSASSPD